MMKFPKLSLGLPTLALCSIALCSLTGLAAQKVQVFDGQPETRNLSRLFYYTQDGEFMPKGQVFVDHGVPKWDDKYEARLEQAPEKTMRWRFGAGAWTRLDTNVDLTFGKTKVAAGSYYAVLEMNSEKEIHLVLLDPAALRAKKMDAFQAGMTTGGIHIPLQWTKTEKSMTEFNIALAADKKEPAAFTMTVRWGKHQLVTQGMAHLD